MTETDQKKTQMLSNVFSSVFTSEPDIDIPKLETKVVENQLEGIIIAKEEVIRK